MDTQFNGTLQWSTNGAPNTYDVQSVAVHEAGHWLHLGHSADPTAIMSPPLATGTLARVLQPDDIVGVRIALAPLVAVAAWCVWTGIAPGWWLLLAGVVALRVQPRRRR